MSTTPPPPPPPWDDLAPPGSTGAETASPDPTPILSTIGQINASTWGPEPIRLVRLQGVTVAWNVQYFATLGIAAVLPWALGKPAVVWSTALVVTQVGSGSLSGRFVKKRGVSLRFAVSKENRIQMTVRVTLVMAILTIWGVGVARAFDAGIGWILYGVSLVVFVIVSGLVKARRRG